MARSYDRDPSCGMCASLDTEPALYSDDLWVIRPIEPPWAIVGWMLMISRRHCSNPAAMDDDEARDLGTSVRHFERTLQRVTGAERIYTAALGEQARHLHIHMVPRYAQMPNNVSGWAVFDLQRAAAAGEAPLVDGAEAARIHAAYADALRR